MNPGYSNLEPSQIRELNALKQPGDLDLGLGEPVLPPLVEPFYKALEWVKEHGCRYGPNLGLPEVREAVGDYLGVSASEVCITHGSQEALYVALKSAVNPVSDEVLIVEPCYPAYYKICAAEGIRYRRIGLPAHQGFKPQVDLVLRAVDKSTRLVVVNSPCNPTGRIWSTQDLSALLEGLNSRGCRLLCDEAYRELYYTDEPIPCARRLDPNALVVGSVSKSHSLTGLRLGWLSAPSCLMPVIHRCHQLLTTAASVYSQRVALEVLRRGESFRTLYCGRRSKLLAVIDSLGLDCLPPEGAFYTMLRIPGGGDSHECALNLLESMRVITIPGVAFGREAEGWLRVSWAAEPKVVEAGLHRVALFFKEGKAPYNRN